MADKTMREAPERSEFIVKGKLATYDLKDALRHNPLLIQAGDDISARALERIEQLEADLDRSLCAIVKSLEWFTRREVGAGTEYAQTPMGEFTVWEGHYRTPKSPKGIPSDKPRAAAQADYARLMAEGLDIRTVDEVREECVQRVSDWFDQFTAGEVMTCDLEDLSQAIREGG